MSFDPVYTLLRNLTSPLAAITTSAGGVRNGLIVNSAQRASLVPTIPRISIYISKINFTHDLIYRGGVFTLHLLRNDQWDVIYRLGFETGRDGDKLNAFELLEGKTGLILGVANKRSIADVEIATEGSGRASPCRTAAIGSPLRLENDASAEGTPASLRS